MLTPVYGHEINTQKMPTIMLITFIRNSKGLQYVIIRSKLQIMMCMGEKNPSCLPDV